MKRSLSKGEMVLPKLIESTKDNSDSKSIFGLLLLLEREIRLEAQHRSSDVAMPEGKKLVNRGSTIFRSYIE
jgi:hypothetical protein